MKTFPKKLQSKLAVRQQCNGLRTLKSQNDRIDFSSNDYLGFAKSKRIFERTHQYLATHGIHSNGATGSRLLSGNHDLYTQAEATLSDFHHTKSALIFNSGYDANVGFFAAVPQRGDLILYDALIHASIRDGVQMSLAKSYKFAHNDLDNLEQRLQQACLPTKQAQSNTNEIAPPEIYVVTEAVFSMDGDQPDLLALVALCKRYHAHLIIDEAHAIGVFGENGSGLVQQIGVADRVFARIVTFGKAMGCHGAAVLGSEQLRSYLINFARSFIYTTGLPPHTIATIQSAYAELQTTPEIEKLQQRIQFFRDTIEKIGLQSVFIPSYSAIQCCIWPGNEAVKTVAAALQEAGFEVKPIVSPTVAVGEERLRFCLHAYNSDAEIAEVLRLLAISVLESETGTQWIT